MRSIESMSDLGWRSRIVERCARLRYDDPVGYEATTWRSMVGRAPEGSRIPVPCAWIRPIHPIPRVILAPGIKAIADSRIAASCKKFAIQVDPTRCPVLAPSLLPPTRVLVGVPRRARSLFFLLQDFASVLQFFSFYFVWFARMAHWITLVLLVVATTILATESRVIPAEPGK